MFPRLRTINILWVHVIGLLGCTAYLTGNIVFSILDKTDYSCLVMTTNPDIYYRPMAVMQLVLIWLAFASTPLINPSVRDWIKELWRFYLWLAYSQVIKMFFRNPTIENILDYGFLFVAIIYLLINLHKLYKSRKLQ